MDNFPTPAPSITAQFPASIDHNALGSSFDLLLLLLVHRVNKGIPFANREIDQIAAHPAPAQALSEYLSTGKIPDRLLDSILRSAVRRHRSFTFNSPRTFTRPSRDLRAALRHLHDSASQLNWTAQRAIYRGHISTSKTISVQADLILDSTLLETKTVANTNHHQEHVCQLLAYYLVSEAPLEKAFDFRIDHLALYYPRQTQLLKCPVSRLLRIPALQLERAAFDFLSEFQLWRDCPDPDRYSLTNLKLVRSQGLRHLLMDVRPQLPWIIAALKARRSGNPIRIPKDFLLND